MKYTNILMKIYLKREWLEVEVSERKKEKKIIEVHQHIAHVLDFESFKLLRTTSNLINNDNDGQPENCVYIVGKYMEI